MDTAALVDQMVDGYNRHDTDALAACYAPNAAIHPAGWSEEVDAGTWLTVTSLAHTSGRQTVTAAEATTTGGSSAPGGRAAPPGACSSISIRLATGSCKSPTTSWSDPGSGTA